MIFGIKEESIIFTLNVFFGYCYTILVTRDIFKEIFVFNNIIAVDFNVMHSASIVMNV